MGNQSKVTRTIAFDLVVPEKPFAQLPELFPNATAHVTIELGQGTDQMEIEVYGLPPQSEYTVFLTEKRLGPFGAAVYIADFITDEDGAGRVAVQMQLKEAFAVEWGGGSPANFLYGPRQLNHVVIWPADPQILAPFLGRTVVAPFDDDLTSGPAILTTPAEFEQLGQNPLAAGEG